MNTKKNKKSEAMFLFVLAILAWAVISRFYRSGISEFNTTLYALSYKYGFISRGLVGTLWQMADHILPINLMTYEAVFHFTEFVTLLFYVALFRFFSLCINLCLEEQKRNMRYLVVFLGIFCFPMFLGMELFGRLDIYLYIFTIVCMNLMIREKAEWLIVPICILCTMIHQGFVFTNANIILVMLFVKMMTREGKARKKYLLIFLATFISISAFFLYFEFFSHTNGTEIAQEIIPAAKSLSEDGKSYNKAIVDHEILGKDVYTSEREYHILNYKQFPAFVVLFGPYIYIVFRFMKKLVADKDIRKKLAYLAVALGPATLIPEMILKVDYGRYVFMAAFYYLGIVMMLIATKDHKVEGELQLVKKGVKRHVPVWELIYIYPMFMMPFFDVVINASSHKLSKWVFNFVTGLFS